MKTWSNSVLAAVLAVVVGISLGCGGGGGGPSTSSGGGGGGGGGAIPVAGQYLEFFGQNGAQVDPLNLTAGSSYTVQYVNYDLVGSRSVLSAHNWTLQGTGSASISGTGIMQVPVDPNVNFKVSAQSTVSGTVKTLTQDCRVARGTASVSGKVMSSNGVTGLVYVQVDIYDNNLNRVGGCLTGAGGAFTAVCPTNAKWITLKSATIPDTYFSALSYQGKDYSVFGTTCLAALPTLAGGNNALPAPMIVPRLADGPPPPPSGCGS
ncbi:MAG: hypothetical protein KF857_09470 [Fimbriimonadaceae bacterium]|nr:hypothetical protein [Fimbriimonadaceae bacterium]